MKQLKSFVPLAIFIAIVVVSYVGFSLDDRHQLPSALLDQAFPEFSAPLLYEPARSVTRSDLVGRPTLVNVWATWCPTCKAEHDVLMEIAAISDIVLVGLNYKDERQKALAWLANYGDPYDLVMSDEDGTIGVDLGVYGAPETFLLDAQGRIIYKRVGDINKRIWRGELLPRLRDLGVTTRSSSEL